MNPLLKRSDMARDSKGITQFCLPPTHEPYTCLYPQPQGITALWLVLITPTHGGMARLSWPGWLVIYWDRFSGTGDWTPDTVTHPGTNRARRRLTSLIETNALTTTPNRQPGPTVHRHSTYVDADATTQLFDIVNLSHRPFRVFLACLCYID